jgi:hypothetical protein
MLPDMRESRKSGVGQHHAMGRGAASCMMTSPSVSLRLRRYSARRLAAADADAEALQLLAAPHSDVSGITRMLPFSIYEMMMWLKWPGTLARHLSQSARKPMLNDFFMPGWRVQLLRVWRERMWPGLRPGTGVAGAEVV